MNFIDFLIISISCIVALIIFFIALYLFFHRQKNVKFLITFVEAETGQGKTSLSVALAKCWHKNYEETVKQMFLNEYETLKENGYPEIEMPRTLCHSDTTAFLSLDENGNGIEPFLDCDFSRLDMPTEENYKDIDYYPIGSYFLFDEISNKARNRNWTQFADTKATLLNLHRKAGYNLTFISPDMSATEKTIRDSAHIIRVVLGTEFKLNKNNDIKSVTWYFVDYYGKNKVKNADNGVMTAGRFMPFEFYPAERKEIMKWKYTFIGNIFKYYDSFRERLYFYNHLVKFKNKDCRVYISSRFDSKALYKEHPFMQIKSDTRSVKDKRLRKEKNSDEVKKK